MRELLAKAIAVILGLSVLALAAVFAVRQNEVVRPAPVELVEATSPPLSAADSARIPRGSALVAELGCRRCHAVEGAGNPRSPLDGIGSRRSPTELRAWIIADPSVRAALPRSAARAKQAYADLPESDLEALVAFLSSLREGRAP